MNDSKNLPPLEASILRALQAIDSQIDREMQRTPADRETHGVQKWAPMSTRIERIVTFALDQFSQDEVKIESLLVMAQALTKAVRFAVEELGEDGLGKMRSDYCRRTVDEIGQDAHKASQVLNQPALN